MYELHFLNLKKKMLKPFLFFRNSTRHPKGKHYDISYFEMFTEGPFKVPLYISSPVYIPSVNSYFTS